MYSEVVATLVLSVNKMNGGVPMEQSSGEIARAKLSGVASAVAEHTVEWRSVVTCNICEIQSVDHALAAVRMNG